MLRLSEKLFIPDNEIEFNFIRSSGPGGQQKLLRGKVKLES